MKTVLWQKCGAGWCGLQSVDLTNVMLELQKASLAFRAMTEVRNKLVDAYTQVMNMSV